MPRSRPALTAVLAAAIAIGLVPAAASAAPETPSAGTPAPDLLDVDLATGSFADAAQQRASQVFGPDPAITSDRALGVPVATFTGANVVRYDFADGYDVEALTVECTFRLDAAAVLDDRTNICGAKEAGGFSLTAGETVRVLVNVDGTYFTVGADITEGVWYHVAGVWNGAILALYVNGALVDQVDAAGESIKAPPTAAQYFFVAADTNASGQPEYRATGQVAQAAVYGRALSGEQVASRYAEVFADRTSDVPGFELTSPDPDERLRAPTTVAGTLTDDDLLAGALDLRLDGDTIAVGDEVGPGLSRGEHTVTYSGFDRLGNVVEGSETFTSDAIPTAGGTQESSGDGSAQLTARATHPTGGQLRTAFLEGQVSPAERAQVGTIPAAAFDRVLGVAGDVTLQDPVDVDDGLFPADGSAVDSPETGEVSALRSQVAFTAPGQSIVWRGAVDPAREAYLLLLNTQTGRYEIADAARGSAEGQIQLAAVAAAANDGDGAVQVLVVAVDPFADDLDEPVQDSFGDPADFDFSLMHITDTQYLSSASVNPAKGPEEQVVWQAGYEDSYRWVAEHGDEYDVAFVAHTGDLIDHWRSSSTDVDRAVAEYEIASGAQSILDATGIPNAVLPGNHDNRDGDESGPESMFNTYFGPDRYEALAPTEGWRERNAEYHPWAPGDNDNGYVLFSAGGEDFVVVALGYDVSDAEADWASGVFEEYSTRNGIVMTHAAHAASDSPDGRGGAHSSDGATISERIMEENPNVMLLLAGHVTGATINVRRDVGEPGNNVVELTSDYQSYRIGTDRLGLTEIGNYDGDTPVTFGATFFRLLQFDLDRGELNVDTYSAHLDEFGATEYDTQHRYDGREDDFRVPIQVHGRTTVLTSDALVGLTPTPRVIGQVVHASGADATVTWRGLEDAVPYGWYAVTQATSRRTDGAGLQSLVLAGPAGGSVDRGIVQFGLFTGSAGAQASDAVPVGTPSSTASGDVPAGAAPR